MKINSAILSLVALLSLSMPRLATCQKSDSTAPRFRIEVTDQPNQKRFLIVLKSLDNRPLCLGVEQWPDQLGQLDTGSRRARVTSSEGTFLARDASFGYCAGDACVLHVAPGSTLKGFIGYAEFGSAAAIAGLRDRRLHFPVTTWVCKK
jgi:hypothetical protein